MTYTDDVAKVLSAIEPVPQRDAVNKESERFYVVRTAWARQLILYYPVVVTVLLFVDGIAFQGRQILYDLFRVTGYIAVAIASIFFLRLFIETPETLKRLWNSGALKESQADPPDSTAYIQFIRDSENNLNSSWGWLLAFAGLVYYVALFSDVMAIQSIGGVVRFGLAALTWIVLGMIVWRLLIIGYMVSMIPRKFNLTVRPAHPDQSGGLQPLGDLCFANALVVIVPVIYFAAWIVVLAYPRLLTFYPQLADFKPYLEGGLIQGGLFALTLLGLIVFFLPIMEIRRYMVRQRQVHQQRLDDLARRIDEINQRLINSAELTEPSEVQKQLDTLKWMRQIYQENKFFPVWPFNRDLALKLTASQVVPLLSLTGIGKPVLDVVGNLMGLLH